MKAHSFYCQLLQYFLNSYPWQGVVVSYIANCPIKNTQTITDKETEAFCNVHMIHVSERFPKQWAHNVRRRVGNGANELACGNWGQKRTEKRTPWPWKSQSQHTALQRFCTLHNYAWYSPQSARTSRSQCDSLVTLPQAALWSFALCLFPSHPPPPPPRRLPPALPPFLGGGVGWGVG